MDSRALFKSLRASTAGREHDRVSDRHDAAFGLGKRQAVVCLEDALDDGGIGEIGIAVAHVRDGAVAPDHEPHGHASLERGVASKAVLVAEAEAAVVLANDALDHLARQPAAHREHTEAHCTTLLAGR